MSFLFYFESILMLQKKKLDIKENLKDTQEKKISVNSDPHLEDHLNLPLQYIKNNQIIILVQLLSNQLICF